MKTIQLDILRRFMSQSDINNLLKSYKGSQKTKGGSMRQYFLESTPTSTYLSELEAYLTDFDTPLSVTARTHARSAAVRLIYQHPEVISRWLK